MQFMGFQPGGHLRVRVERGGDVGARRALAHHCGVGAFTEGQCQRVDQDGFAGASLAREHGKAVGQVEVQGVDDDEIADGQAAQHGASGDVWVYSRLSSVGYSCQCSFLRSVA